MSKGTSKESLPFLKQTIIIDISNLTHELTVLDSIIEAYNEQLQKAQPLFSGRVLIKFTNKDRIRFDGQVFYEKLPCIGKMVKTRYGWKFFWIKNPDLQKLHELRVGKGLRGDAVVVKLLKSISDILIRRSEVVSQLKRVRNEVSKSTQSVEHLHKRKFEELLDIIPRIKVDWTKDADALYKKFKATPEAGIMTVAD